ncbi:MAG: hypothetical protein JW779_14425 [Candidatus Thorarchaeota archaeon]|nr:hypothetical protein [Candidatus Thorarchaeota archaeon]
MAADEHRLYLTPSSTLKIYDNWVFEKKEQINFVEGFSFTWITQIHVDDDYIYCGLSDGSIEIVSTDDFEIYESIKGHEKKLNSVAFHTDEFYNKDHVLGGCKDGVLRHWVKEKDGIQWKLEELKGHTSEIKLVVTDGMHAFTASSDSSVRIWDISGLAFSNPIVTIAEVGYWIGAMSTDEKYLYVSESGGVSIFDKETGKRAQQLQGKEGFSDIKALAVYLLEGDKWGEYDRLLFCGFDSGLIKVYKGTPKWRGDKWKLIQQLELGDSCDFFTSRSIIGLELDEDYVYAETGSGSKRRWKIDDLSYSEEVADMPSRSSGRLGPLPADGSVILVTHMDSKNSAMPKIRSSLDDDHLVVFGDTLGYFSVVTTEEIFEMEDMVFEVVFKEVENLSEPADLFDYVAKSETKADAHFEEGDYASGFDMFSVLIKSLQSSKKTKSVLGPVDH